MSSTSELLNKPADASSTRDAKVVALVATAHFASHVHVMLLPPIFGVVKQHFGVVYTDIALALTVDNAVHSHRERVILGRSTQPGR